MTIKNKDWLVFAVIYLLSLAFMLHYNLTHPIINDGVYEYRGYMLNIQEGWQYRHSSINSVLVSIWLPAMIQRLTHWDAMTILRVFPPLFYALMPSFIYLIAKRYQKTKYAILSVLVVVLSSYIIFFPDVGRMGVVFGLLAGMVWALLNRRIVWSAGFSFLIVFAHYGTTIIVIGMLSVMLIGLLVAQKFNLKASYPLLKPYLVAFCVMVVFTGMWHFGIAHYSGDSMWFTILRPDEARGVLGSLYDNGQENFDFGEWWKLTISGNGTSGNGTSGNGTSGIFNLESRDTVTQQAFGLGFVDNPIPLKVEIVANWLIVAFISLGMLVMLRKREVDSQFKIMVATLYGLLVATVVIPSFSFFYGTQRVYFTAMVVLAACFPFGIVKVSKWMHVPPVVLATIVLCVYGLSTSGLIYLPFGLEKSIPVVLTLP